MAGSWFRQPTILPGFGLTLGFTTFFLSALVLLPLAALVFKTASLTWPEFLAILTDERAVASPRLDRPDIRETAPGVADGRRRDAEQAGEVANRRQT